MDKNKNYYDILGVTHDSDNNQIKKAYYKLSFTHHPDKGGDAIIFGEMTEAYDVLCDDEKIREEYDCKSRYGKCYDEYYELFDINVDFSYDDGKEQLEKFKRNEINNIQIEVDETFDGKIEYVRWVKCKPCDGSGKDMSGKILIRDLEGNIVKTFDAEDGCDFCFDGYNNVITENGPKFIKDVKLGDFVLSSNNNYYEVVNLMNRDYSGNLYDINVCGINVVGVTPNHKFNIVRFKRNKQGRVNINNYDILESSVDEVTTDDFVLYQTRKYKPKSKIILEKTINRDLSEILIDDNFVKFIACYITEGNTRDDRVVVITMHIEKDKHLVDFIKHYMESIGNTIKCFQNDSWGDKVIKIEIFNSQLSKFLKKFCGHRAENKFINNDILGASDQSLLETLLLCDGYHKKNLRTYTTVSEKLGNQVLHLALGLGHNASISRYKSYVDKHDVNHQACYRVYITFVGDLTKVGIYNKKIKEGTCLKVKSINKREVLNNKVYNITVDKTHKYTIDGLLVNNCEGTGKSYDGSDCSFCVGQGKVGLKPCDKCEGHGRTMGNQKLSGIKLTDDETKLDTMGHFSKNGVGYLLLVKKIKNNS